MKVKEGEKVGLKLKFRKLRSWHPVGIHVSGSLLVLYYSSGRGDHTPGNSEGGGHAPGPAVAASPLGFLGSSLLTSGAR